MQMEGVGPTSLNISVGGSGVKYQGKSAGGMKGRSIH